MKQCLLLMLSLLFITSACSNDDDNNGYSDNGTTRSVHVKNAGTLPELISEDEMYKITSLKISGVLNGTDIQILRKMAGIDEHGRQTGGILANLDMGDTKIVAGGEPYDGNYQTDYDIIGKYMFSDCISLKSIILPNSVTTIKSGAFANCDNLKSVTLPQNIHKIGELFTAYYSDNEDYPLVYIFSSTPPELSSYSDQEAFLYVPKGCRQKYLDAEGRKSIFKYIFEEGETLDDISENEDDSDNEEDDYGLSPEVEKALRMAISGSYVGATDSGWHLENKIYFYNDTLKGTTVAEKTDSVTGVIGRFNTDSTFTISNVPGRLLAKEFPARYSDMKKALEEGPALMINGSYIISNVTSNVAALLFGAAVEIPSLTYGGETHQNIRILFWQNIATYGYISGHKAVELPMYVAAVYEGDNKLFDIYDGQSTGIEQYKACLMVRIVR